MKQYLVILFFVAFASVKAQTNLVPNPSFETYTTCPEILSSGGCSTIGGFDYVKYALPWQRTTAGSPDYYNACAYPVPPTESSAGVPNNALGYQYARTGNGYTGLFTYEKGTNFREYISAPLLSPLASGVNYYVSMYVNCSNSNISNPFNEGFTPADRIGIYLSNGYPDTTGVYNGCETGYIHQIPQAENPSGNLLIDTLNWIKISSYYTAIGGENWITIGNFRSDSMTIALRDSAYDKAYYYIDDVSVIDTTTTTIISQIKSQNTEMKIYPNPVSTILNVDCLMINESDAQCTIYDVLGNTIKHLLLNTKHLEIDVSSLENGIYFIRIENTIQKIVKQ